MDYLKKVLSIGLIIFLSIINYMTANSAYFKGIDAFSAAIDSVDAELVQVNINSSGKINDKFLSKDELIKIKDFLIEELSIKGSEIDNNSLNNINSNKNYFALETTESKTKNELTLSGKDALDKSITLILISYKDELYNIEETQLVIDITHNNQNIVASDINKVLNRIYDKFNSNSKITTCFTGAFDGILNNENKYMKLSKIMNLINFNKVEGIKSKQLISISGYSDNIDKYIYSGTNKININLAMRYSEYEDKTYVWIATPLITVGY